MSVTRKSPAIVKRLDCFQHSSGERQLRVEQKLRLFQFHLRVGSHVPAAAIDLPWTFKYGVIQ
jgi:hypothetical protein